MGSKLGFALDLKTNGTLLTAESADRIAARGPRQVDISLLGATGATFDAIARGRRTLERVLRGVRLLQARGVRLKLNTLLLDLNLAEREAMLDIARQLGVEYGQVVKVSAVGTAAIGQGATSSPMSRWPRSTRPTRHPFSSRYAMTPAAPNPGQKAPQTPLQARRRT